MFLDYLMTSEGLLLIFLISMFTILLSLLIAMYLHENKVNKYSNIGIIVLLCSLFSYIGVNSLENDYERKLKKKQFQEFKKINSYIFNENIKENEMVTVYTESLKNMKKEDKIEIKNFINEILKDDKINHGEFYLYKELVNSKISKEIKEVSKKNKKINQEKLDKDIDNYIKEIKKD